MTARKADIASLPSPAARLREATAPRRGLHREEAALYIGVSTTKLDEMVRDGRMPGPKRIDGRNVWDIRALDMAFDALPDDGRGAHNPWDDDD